MELKIEIDNPAFNKYRLPTETENNIWGNKAVLVSFPNCVSSKTNNPFLWMPTYKQLLEIFFKLHECEQVNRDLAREYFKNKEVVKNGQETGGDSST